MALLGIGRTKLYELLNDNTLDSVKIGRRTLVRRASLRRLKAILSMTRRPSIEPFSQCLQGLARRPRVSLKTSSKPRRFPVLASSFSTVTRRSRSSSSMRCS
ncbi:helix-turn-helix domain-containing protein [Rhodospirillum sp. A1_3_36]|uniref:helix-turn-helix domain-containing protein n=1 Tax=Rhodospirillum sp. A1_3_36 TaxID=3391666 RepID=UPI0039A6E771